MCICLIDVVTVVAKSLFNEPHYWAQYEAQMESMKEQALGGRKTTRRRRRKTPDRFCSSRHSTHSNKRANEVEVEDLTSPPITPEQNQYKRARRSLVRDNREVAGKQKQKQTKKHQKLSEAHKLAGIHDLAVRERRVNFQSTRWWAQNANKTAISSGRLY